MFRDEWALVTGAASGIGRATAELLAERGAKLILVDRDAERLSEFAAELGKSGHEVLTRVVDVADRAAMMELRDWVHARVEALDLLVNNAGVLAVGGFEDTSFDDFERLLAINLRGAVHGVKLFVPAMRQRGRGTVVNVASASGIVGFTPLTAYSTSKFAVVGFSAAVGAEVARDGVHVCCVCPGLVRTALADSCQQGEEVRSATERLLETQGMSVLAVAKAIVRGAERRRPLVHVGAQARFIAWLDRLAPAHAARWVNSISRRLGSQV